MRLNKLSTGILAFLLLSCSGSGVPQENQEVKSYKVAVVLPESEKAELSKIVDWAQETIKSAQKGQESRIELELEWIDEDIPNLEEEVRRVTHDASYAAVVGPKYSRHARLVAKESLALRMPVIMPSVTSAEVQRIYSGSNKTDPNIFFMSESDLSQCQALLTTMSRKLGITYGNCGSLCPGYSLVIM